MNHLRIREQPLDGEDLLEMEQYLAACISGSSLRLLELKFYNFRTYNGQYSDGDQALNAEELLSQLCTLELEIVNISDLMASQNAFEHLASSIGDRASFIRMKNLKIPTGSWTKVLDLLHSKLALRCIEGRCDAHTRELYGGEFAADKVHQGGMFE